MSHKILHTVAGGALGLLTGGPIGGLVGGILGNDLNHAVRHKSSGPQPFQPTVLDKNQTTMQPDDTQLPRRKGALTPLGQSQTGGSILSDTLGG